MFEHKKLRLVPEMPYKYQDDIKYPTPEFFNNFFAKSGSTLSAYPVELRADSILAQYFISQAQRPTERFIKMLNYTANFYKNVVNLTQILGSKTGKHYHFLLGAVNSKKLRYTIASSQETRNLVLDYGRQSLPYLVSDCPEFASSIDKVHLISLHIGVLRSELMEVNQLQDMSTDDPLVRLFAIGKYLIEEKDVIERDRGKQDRKAQMKLAKIEAIERRRKLLYSYTKNSNFDTLLFTNQQKTKAGYTEQNFSLSQYRFNYQ